MSQLEVSVHVTIRETEDSRSPEGQIERLDSGQFRLVLAGDQALNIDGLEQSLLEVNYPALREALSSHLEEVAKKKPINTSTFSAKVRC